MYNIARNIFHPMGSHAATFPATWLPWQTSFDVCHFMLMVIESSSQENKTRLHSSFAL